MWRHYYERWASMTIDQIGPAMVGLVPELATFVFLPAFLTSTSTLRGREASCISSCETVTTDTLLESWRGGARERRVS